MISKDPLILCKCIKVVLTIDSAGWLTYTHLGIFSEALLLMGTLRRAPAREGLDGLSIIVALRDHAAAVVSDLRREFPETGVIEASVDASLGALCRRLAPCVVVADDASPDLLANSGPQGPLADQCGVAVLLRGTALRDEQALRLLYAGIAGMVGETCPGPELVGAVRALARGEYWVSRRLLAQYCRLLRSELRYSLTRREREIWRRIAGGEKNHEIAAHLGISPHTVHWHIHAVYRKINVATRGEAEALWFGRFGDRLAGC